MEDDEFFDTDLEDESCAQELEDKLDQVEIRERSPREIYLEVCKSCDIVPSSRFLKQYSSENVDLNHYGLGDPGTRAICVALEGCTNVTDLQLQDNGIRDKGITAVAKMLKRNRYIVKVDLSRNLVERKGLDALADMLMQNNTLKELNISKCNTQGKSISAFCKSLRLDAPLTYLNLSYNDIGDKGAIVLGSAIKCNVILDFLDVSWNSIRVKGAQALAEGLKMNTRLRELNIAWNGLLDDGIAALQEALLCNQSLKVLDVGSNCITNKGVFAIAKFLKTNKSLEVLKTGRNPFQSYGACVLLRAIQKNPSSVLRELQMDDIVFDKDCARELELVLEGRPSFTCSWNISIIGERKSDQTKKPELTDIYLAFVRTRGLRFIELFKILSKDSIGQRLTKEDFVRGMKKLNAPMHDFKLRELFDMMDANKNGVIVFQEFVLWTRERYQASGKVPQP
ncbi:leucine-rich repeat-containing protein 74A-like [Montipora foliosa]|uniref:leucine-rich repeat-containing protein 74A-like n=1 Tax=Montipora foliosa TaxID=591990 RepID=UPI0035F1AE9A